MTRGIPSTEGDQRNKALVLEESFGILVLFCDRKRTEGLSSLCNLTNFHFYISFQLSFSAVIAIALIYPLLYKILMPESLSKLSLIQAHTPPSHQKPCATKNIIMNILLRWLLAGIAFTTAATLGTLPLLIFHFNRFSLAAPISNLLVEPLICFWALILGLFASLCLPLAPLLAKALFTLGSVGLASAEKICASNSIIFGNIPFLCIPGKYCHIISPAKKRTDFIAWGGHSQPDSTWVCSQYYCHQQTAVKNFICFYS